MSAILVTGFDPFGGAHINPSWEAVRRLPDTIGAFRLEKLQVPTVFTAAGQTVLSRCQSLQPRAIVCVGQAGGRDSITPEVIAINLREAGIPDNRGFCPNASPVIPGAPDGYFSTLPIRPIVQSIRAAGYPARLSYSAGSFVCNDLLFTLLHHYRDTDTVVGFLHVPYLPEQTETAPSMPLPDITAALTAALTTLAEFLEAN